MNLFGSLGSVGVSVSAIIILSSICTHGKDTVTDADGNVYTTVKIGNQIWTVENLRTTKYNDGTPIPLITGRSEWIVCDDSARSACCWYENDTIKKKTHGALYNWYAVNTGKLAPEGWHVPTDTEWTMMEKYLVDNGYNWDKTTDGSKIAKSMAATTGWLADSTPGTVGNEPSKNNRSRFSALPGGFRRERGDYFDIGYHGYWWSSTEDDTYRAWRRSLYYNKAGLTRHSGTLRKGCGFSVRLVKD